jgi:raffinose/stachyose/melibiose transport system permease protein
MATTGQDIGWAGSGVASAAQRQPHAATWIEALRRSGTPGRIAALLLLWGLTVVALYPLVWLVTNSLKSAAEMFDRSWALPEIWQWENYAKAWGFGLGQYIVNSVLVTTASVTLIVLIGALSAFVLTVLHFPGKKLVYGMILGGLILPPEVSLFPLFKILTTLGLYNTYGAMILPYVAFGLPFTTFLLRAYMTTIPTELHEAAIVDGAGLLRIFWSIYLPVSRPALASAALIMGMRVWNEFIFALTFVESNDLRTLTIGISTFGDALRLDWAVLMAGLVISIIPVLGAFLLMQRQFIGGMTQGAVK